MTTENNAAAQAGDEPMRAAFEAWHRSRFATRHSTGQPTRDMHNGIYADEYGPEHQQKMWDSFCAGYQVSLRATADVERNAKRQAERVERLVRAAKVYTFNYLQDEHEEPELCTCGPKQHAELVELFAALAAIATTKPGA